MADTEECSSQSLEEIYSAHFTVCQKPWTCSPYRTRLCDALRDAWFTMRREAEEYFGLAVQSQACVKHKYISMDLHNAALKYKIFRADDSPDLLSPTPGSGF